MAKCKACNQNIDYFTAVNLGYSSIRDEEVCDKCYKKLEKVIHLPDIHSEVDFDEYLKNLNNVLDSMSVPQNCYEFLKEILIKNKKNILETQSVPTIYYTPKRKIKRSFFFNLVRTVMVLLIVLFFLFLIFSMAMSTMGLPSPVEVLPTLGFYFIMTEFALTGVLLNISIKGKKRTKKKVETEIEKETYYFFDCDDDDIKGHFQNKLFKNEEVAVETAKNYKATLYRQRVKDGVLLENEIIYKPD